MGSLTYQILGLQGSQKHKKEFGNVCASHDKEPCSVIAGIQIKDVACVEYCVDQNFAKEKKSDI